jgi:hypothetical protein
MQEVQMHTRAIATSLLLCIFAAQIVAADNPFAGTWKLDLSRSELAGPKMTIEKAGEKYRMSAGGDSYAFQTNGKEQPGLYGRVVAWKEVDANTWERTTKFKGAVLSQATLTVSSDGKTLTETAKGTRPDGEAFESTTVYDRIGQGSGPVGTWRSKTVSMSAPQSFEIAGNGEDGISFDIPALKAKCQLKFDGKDYPQQDRRYRRA